MSDVAISLEDCHGDEELFQKVCNLSSSSWDAGYKSAINGCACCPKDMRIDQIKAIIKEGKDNLKVLRRD